MGNVVVNTAGDIAGYQGRGVTEAREEEEAVS